MHSKRAWKIPRVNTRSRRKNQPSVPATVFSAFESHLAPVSSTQKNLERIIRNPQTTSPLKNDANSSSKTRQSSTVFYDTFYLQATCTYLHFTDAHDTKTTGDSMQPIVTCTHVCGVWQSVTWLNSASMCRDHSVQPLPNHFGVLLQNKCHRVHLRVCDILVLKIILVLVCLVT